MHTFVDRLDRFLGDHHNEVVLALALVVLAEAVIIWLLARRAATLRRGARPRPPGHAPAAVARPSPGPGPRRRPRRSPRGPTRRPGEPAPRRGCRQRRQAVPDAAGGPRLHRPPRRRRRRGPGGRPPRAPRSHPPRRDDAADERHLLPPAAP